MTRIHAIAYGLCIFIALFTAEVNGVEPTKVVVNARFARIVVDQRVCRINIERRCTFIQHVDIRVVKVHIGQLRRSAIR